MTNPTPYLQIQNIAKSFGKTTVLHDISLTINEGEFVFLLGPSGCGKTTLLRLIAGLEMPSAGQIVQAGRDVTQLPAANRDFGIVFQSYALFPNLTVAQNIGYGLQNTGTARAAITARVQELLQLVGLPGLESRYPAQLSGGQQQRVALARALAMSPGLLLLDEPLSALDARVRASLRTEIATLQRRLGLTTIMVTHDQEEALTMADRIVVMDRGHIVQVDTPIKLYQQPATPFVADFVGQMNFLKGRVGANGGGLVESGNAHLHVHPWPEALTPGSQVQLAIRPEEIRVIEQPNGMANVLHAEVRNVEFMGPHYWLHLNYVGDATTQTTSRLTVQAPRHLADQSHLAPGATVAVHLPAEALRLFATGETV